MKNPEPFIRYIESIQQRLDIPECFELSQELLESQTSIETLMTRILTNTSGAGDKYAMLEIIKQWLKSKEEESS